MSLDIRHRPGGMLFAHIRASANQERIRVMSLSGFRKKNVLIQGREPIQSSHRVRSNRRGQTFASLILGTNSHFVMHSGEGVRHA